MLDGKTTVFGALVAAAVIGAAPASAASLISNGDFEADPTDSDTITGWSVLEENSSSVTLLNGSSYIPCCGATGAQLSNKFVSFGAGQSPVGPANRIFQQFVVSTTGVYTLKFMAGAVGSGGQPLNFVIDTNAGVALLSGTTGVLSATNNFDNLFSSFEYNFTVNEAGPLRLSFWGGTPTNNVDILVDNVSVAAVPEPGTWAMLLLGLGLIGAAMRVGKKRSKIAVSYA